MLVNSCLFSKALHDFPDTFAWKAAPPVCRRILSAQGQAALSITGQPDVSAGQLSNLGKEALGQSWTTLGTHAVHCLLEEVPWSVRQPFLSQPSRLPVRQGTLEAAGGP